MIHKRHGYTMNVFKDGAGYRVIVTKPNGSKAFDYAFTAAKAWEIARGHAGIDGAKCGIRDGINMMTGEVQI